MDSSTSSMFCLLIVSFLFSPSTSQGFHHACEGYEQSEIYCYGDFLLTVQMANLYVDQKTFVDRPLKYPTAQVLADFKRLNISGDNLTDAQKEQLSNFINENFHPNGTELEPWDPADSDWIPEPPFLSTISNEQLRSWAHDLHHFWKELGRKIKDDVRDNFNLHSMYYVSHPVIVPGGRFKEFYYWDSYWIQRGLLVSGMTTTVKGMILNFFEMVQNIGFIPNGGRIYYQRSQPPLLLPMVDGYYEATKDLQFIKDNIGTMLEEFNFFQFNRTVQFTKNNKTYVMFRYNVELTDPRPESFKDDYDLVHPLPINRVEEEVLYANLKTGAESGWDFSSRWYVMDNGESLLQGNLTNTKTRDIIPVDLNSFMVWNAGLLEKFCGLIDDKSVCDPEVYMKLKNLLKAAIREVLWDEEAGTWFDYDYVRGKSRKYFYPTNLTPLFVGAEHGDKTEMGKRAVDYLHHSGATNFPGGVPTSMLQTGLQWDFPNGWPPLNHMIVEGLENTGEPSAQNLAYQLAEKWTRSNHLAYVQNEAMFEKYDVSCTGCVGGGGEYEVVVGFGWSNGVVLDFLHKYGDRLTPVPDLPTTTPSASSAPSWPSTTNSATLFWFLTGLIHLKMYTLSITA